MNDYKYILVNMERHEYIEPLHLGAGARSWDEIVERLEAAQRLLVRRQGEDGALLRVFRFAGRWGSGPFALIVVGKGGSLHREIVEGDEWRELSAEILAELLRFMDLERSREVVAR